MPIFLKSRLLAKEFMLAFRPKAPAFLILLSANTSFSKFSLFNSLLGLDLVSILASIYSSLVRRVP